MELKKSWSTLKHSRASGSIGENKIEKLKDMLDIKLDGSLPRTGSNLASDRIFQESIKNAKNVKLQHESN